MKHAFGARLALGDPGTPERPYANIGAAMDTLMDPHYAEDLRRCVCVCLWLWLCVSVGGKGVRARACLHVHRCMCLCESICECVPPISIDTREHVFVHTSAFMRWPAPFHACLCEACLSKACLCEARLSARHACLCKAYLCKACLSLQGMSLQGVSLQGVPVSARHVSARCVSARRTCLASHLHIDFRACLS